MPAVEISKITINRDSRQRRDLTNIEDMMDSLKRRGQIQNIVLTVDNVLVAGERRLEAAKRLGWTHIEAKHTDELDPKELHAIELEENIKRVGLSWQDECRAVKEYHEFRKAEEGGEQSYAKTGTELGYSESHVRERVNVANELLSGNAMVAAAPRFSTARGIVERAQSRAVQQDTMALLELAQSPKLKQPEAILNEDFRLWAPAYTGPKFNFIHCDFPYGIGADKFNQGAASAHGGYDDSEDTYWALVTCLCANLDRIASDSAHIMFWFSMHYYTPTLDFFRRNSDFRIDPFPLVWIKSDNIGILPDPERGPRRIYETALFGSRGDRKIVRPVSNAIASPSQRDEHMSIKPQPMLEHFFRMFVDGSTVALDPTCGSGGAVRAARSLGAANATGLEINPEFCNRARLALKTGE